MRNDSQIITDDRSASIASAGAIIAALEAECLKLRQEISQLRSALLVQQLANKEGTPWPVIQSEPQSL